MRDCWPSSHGGWWVAAFAALFAVLYVANQNLTHWLQASVIAERLDVVFLPAFIRIVSVVVAGAAGLLGLFIGTLLTAVFYVQHPPLLALMEAAASTLGVWAAYSLTVWAIEPQVKRALLPLSLPILVVMTVFYCIFNALIHATMWSVTGIVDKLNVVQLAQMMFGDLLGVIVMFYITRWTFRFFRVMRPVTT